MATMNYEQINCGFFFFLFITTSAKTIVSSLISQLRENGNYFRKTVSGNVTRREFMQELNLLILIKSNFHSLPVFFPSVFSSIPPYCYYLLWSPSFVYFLSWSPCSFLPQSFQFFLIPNVFLISTFLLILPLSPFPFLLCYSPFPLHFLSSSLTSLLLQ